MDTPGGGAGEAASAAVRSLEGGWITVDGAGAGASVLRDSTGSGQSASYGQKSSLSLVDKVCRMEVKISRNA